MKKNKNSETKVKISGNKNSEDDKKRWKNRCFELEDSLQKFRDQAQTIREMLKDKVGHFLFNARGLLLFQKFGS